MVDQRLVLRLGGVGTQGVGGTTYPVSLDAAGDRCQQTCEALPAERVGCFVGRWHGSHLYAFFEERYTLISG